jgi:hypothetical protein
MATKQEMDDHTVINDWYCRMMLQAALTDLWLAQGDLPRAMEEGQTFLAVACATAERTWQAWAWEANARIALASLDLERAQECITEALAAMNGYEVPLAEWQVHATAAELSERSGRLEALSIMAALLAPQFSVWRTPSRRRTSFGQRFSRLLVFTRFLAGSEIPT